MLFLDYLSGEASVVNALFSTLGRIVRGFFLARTRSEADSDDLTQATLLKIHLSRQSFDSRLSLKTWVFTIAHRTLIDHWRKKSRADLTESLDDSFDSIELGGSPGTIELADLISLRALLEKGLDSLKPLDRSIVYLGVVEGLSMAELAVVVNSNEGAIKVRLHRLLRNLRGFLNEAEALEVKT
jgi:RNA polymerase sigma-70 factor (ECF subfamily)